MSKKGIDEVSGTLDVYKLCPEPGDSIMVVNCGTHYEVRHHHWEQQPFGLTDLDIEMMKRGELTWH